jgi:Fe-S oxidoreductase
VAREGYSDAEVEFLWSLPRTVVPMLGRLPGPDRPLPFVEDIAVPPAALLDFLQRAQQVFQKHQVISSLYAHAATGQVHFRPFLAPPEPGNAQRLEELAGDLYEAAWSCGGTISGEHGAGLSRTAWIQKQYGPLYDLFREVKRIFDPHNLFNPGKIISDDPHLMIRDLRPAVPAAVPPAAASTAPAPGEPLVTLQLTWSPAEAAGSAARCNGCGHCRTHDPRLRMCPLFRLEPLEEASPRSKANLIRGYLDKRFSADDFASARMKQIANLCFNCKQCQLECPSQVDIPHMMIEARAAHVAAHGLSWADWTTSRAHAFARIASLFPWLSNGLLRNVAARWVIEKLLGIARQRKLPTFAAETFLRYARRKHLSRPVRDPGRSAAVYFVDHFANYHDPQLGQALERVLRHHGIATIVPLRQTTAGMASISAGDLDAARDLAERNVRQLVEYAREGIPILCTEPAAALCLRVEYPLLLDHPDVKVVAERTLEAGAFLQSMHRANRLRTDFRPVELDAGYHTPCHLKALGDGLPFMELLSLIPGLKLHRIEVGCSGMAGAWGLARVNYLNSLRLGARLMSRMRQGDLAIGLAECSSCRMQMEHGSDSVSTLHPLKLLAYAYGLMPGLESRWRQVGTVRPAADKAAAAH